MNKYFAATVSLVLLTPAFLLSCAASPEAPSTEQTSPLTEQTESSPSEETADSGTGTLEIRANGEDFVRQGFVTKDGWQISFDHLYVTLDDVTAYQTDPPFDPESGDQLQAKEQVSLDQPKTIDLAAGDENADPVLVAELPAPAGRYNALSWKMVPAPSGEAAGYPLVMQGTAVKDGQTVDFTLKFDEELAFTCGDFVGEARKGILEANGKADVEATFHFDHLFGDGEAPPDDEINTGALGFEPFAALADNGQIEADSDALRQGLPEADYNKLLEILPSLGHVGEGHCEETQLKAT